MARCLTAPSHYQHQCCLFSIRFNGYVIKPRPFTLLPVQEDMFSCLLQREQYLYPSANGKQPSRALFLSCFDSLEPMCDAIQLAPNRLDGWHIAEWLVRYHTSGWRKMTLICCDTLFENWYATQEAIRSWLAFTLVPVHIIMSPPYKMIYIYIYIRRLVRERRKSSALAMEYIFLALTNRYTYIHSGPCIRVTTGRIVPKGSHKLCDCAQGIYFWGWTQEIFMSVYVLFSVLVFQTLSDCFRFCSKATDRLQV